MYQLISNQLGIVNVVKLIDENKFIPFDIANSDFQTFKRDLTEGVELQDAEGNVMTPEQVTAFLGTLP